MERGERGQRVGWQVGEGVGGLGGWQRLGVVVRCVGAAWAASTEARQVDAAACMEECCSGVSGSREVRKAAACAEAVETAVSRGEGGDGGGGGGSIRARSRARRTMVQTLLRHDMSEMPR